MSWGYGVQDRGTASIQTSKIKQDLCSLDVAAFCRSFWFQSLGKYQCPDIETFAFDQNQVIDVEAKHGMFRERRYCSSEYLWKVVCHGNASQIDLDLETMAERIEDIIAKHFFKKKQKDSEDTNAWDIHQKLIHIFLPHLVAPWKYVLVFGQKTLRTPGPSFLDQFVNGYIDLWWFYDKKQNDDEDCFCKVILLRLHRKYSHTEW